MVTLKHPIRRTATAVAAFVALLGLIVTIPTSRAQDVDGPPDLFVPVGDTGSVLAGSASSGEVADAIALPSGSSSSPWAVAIGTDGLVYVSDAGTGTVERFDPDPGIAADADADAAVDAVVDTAIAGPGDGGQPLVPRGLAFGPDGGLFVVDAGAGRVLGYPIGADGTVAASPDVTAPPPSDATTGAGYLLDPVDVVVAADGTLLVSDRGDDDIERFDRSSGQHLGTLATLEPGDTPAGMVIDPDGRLLVALSGRGAVVPVDPVTGEVGEPLVDGLIEPIGVVIDADGLVWVSDTWAGTVTAHDRSSGAATGTSLDLSDTGGPRLLAASGAPEVAFDDNDPVDDSPDSGAKPSGPLDRRRRLGGRRWRPGRSGGR